MLGNMGTTGNTRNIVPGKPIGNMGTLSWGLPKGTWETQWEHGNMGSGEATWEHNLGIKTTGGRQ